MRNFFHICAQEIVSTAGALGASALTSAYMAGSGAISTQEAIGAAVFYTGGTIVGRVHGRYAANGSATWSSMEKFFKRCAQEFGSTTGALVGGALGTAALGAVTVPEAIGTALIYTGGTIVGRRQGRATHTSSATPPSNSTRNRQQAPETGIN